VVPYSAGPGDEMDAVELGAPPLRTFMLSTHGKKIWRCVLELAGAAAIRREPRTCPCGGGAGVHRLRAAYRIFQIGVALFLPFLVIDPGGGGGDTSIA